MVGHCKVLEIGDSLGNDLGWGLSRELASTHALKLVQKDKSASGLVTAWFYNWPHHLKTLLKQYHPDLLIVCDDFNLPFARLRMRRGGSEGGNNGLKDITNALGTTDYPRLRFGIGRNGMDAIGFVLGVFTGDEEKLLPEAIERAVAGVRTFCLHGSDAAIELVNSNGGDAVP